MSLELPTWEEVNDKNEEIRNPLEQFIYENEPAEDFDNWRKTLEMAIEYVFIA